MIEQEIHLLKENIVSYASLTARMIEESITGLIEKNESLLNKVIQTDEEKANHTEMEMDERCIEVIARYEPKAKNLRTVLMIMKINNDLERIGDEAVNIAESALYLIKKPEVKKLIDIPRMAEISIKMLKESINSFVTENSSLAREICTRDDIVDSLRDQIIRELITYMVTDPATIERSLQIIRIARSLERIADLSTNFCEDVVFMVEGKNIKHHAEE
ncbi:MAG TPA: phosphate signaling complex protein PhoU [bacterium]|nr:phosphate signaling complex protein PhoU [bacterium]HPP29949.1 phosphate signaling complex protein PhoU [bacterium]